MKSAIFLFFLLLASAFSYARVPEQKYLQVNVVAPANVVFQGVLYSDDTSAGDGMMRSSQGKITEIRIWDMSYNPGEGPNGEDLVTICAGPDEDNAYCPTFTYIEGKSDQTTDWIRGQAEFKVEMHMFS